MFGLSTKILGNIQMEQFQEITVSIKKISLKTTEAQEILPDSQILINWKAALDSTTEPV